MADYYTLKTLKKKRKSRAVKQKGDKIRFNLKRINKLNELGLKTAIQLD